ncbi:Uncharacterized protein FWK35_00018629 [Aphis craccivora]|uniref:Transposable element P transposase-like C-terminal domain-containing protein n=1 Tax=Aphis craccivora TaxID=307492 RepID=A0A6G0YY83_APHCR|nr:Uncharacterized protein FWK35_00018629 [Aphis craccivora]
MLKDADINITINDNDKCVISDTSVSRDDETLNTSNSQKKQYHEHEEMTKDVVEYLIGWVAKKYRKKYPELGSTTTVLDNTCHDYTLATWGIAEKMATEKKPQNKKPKLKNTPRKKSPRK